MCLECEDLKGVLQEVNLRYGLPKACRTVRSVDCICCSPGESVVKCLVCCSAGICWNLVFLFCRDMCQLVWILLSDYGFSFTVS